MKKENERTEKQLIKDLCNAIEDNIMKTLTVVEAPGEVQSLMKAITEELAKRWLSKEEEKSRILTLEDI